MPYDIRRGRSGCKGGFAVVGGTGTVHGCHKTRAAAIQQQRALYAAEAASKKALGKALFGDLKKKHGPVMTNENVPNKQPHSLEECDDPQNCPDHMDKKAPCWDGYVQRGMKPGADGQMVPNCVPVEKMDCCPDEVEKRDYNTEQRRQLARNGQAMPDGSFPIVTEQDLRNAIQSVGRAANYEAAKRHIIRRARALGRMDLLPQDWSGSTKKSMWSDVFTFKKDL